jgi:DNA adenine methylase
VPTSSEPRPFLKWAGGKRQLLPELRRFFPAHVDRYCEPFLGSGAVFFDLWGTGRIRGGQACLSDQNADLIGTYLRVRDSTDAVVTELSGLAAAHRLGGDHYYRVRDERFNPGRRAWLSQGGGPEAYPAALAAMLVYLNRTGFNGLFRLNGAGAFNVPQGRYENPRILDEPRIRAAAAALAGTRISHAPFEVTLQSVRSSDLVYLDPPYAPVSTTASFRAYTATGFTDSDQRRLRDQTVRLAALGALVVLSNSVAPGVVALYETAAARKAGLRCHRVNARRAINSRSDRRGPIEELVVTNAEDLKAQCTRRRSGSR